MSLPRRYDHVYVRVEYPGERGYRMEAKALPSYLHLTISEEGRSKVLTVHSRIHVTKEKKINPVFSNSFTDVDIIKYLTSKIYNDWIN